MIIQEAFEIEDSIRCELSDLLSWLSHKEHLEISFIQKGQLLFF